MGYGLQTYPDVPKPLFYDAERDVWFGGGKEYSSEMVEDMQSRGELLDILTTTSGCDTKPMGYSTYSQPYYSNGSLSYMCGSAMEYYSSTFTQPWGTSPYALEETKEQKAERLKREAEEQRRMTEAQKKETERLKNRTLYNLSENSKKIFLEEIKKFYRDYEYKQNMKQLMFGLNFVFFSVAAGVLFNFGSILKIVQSIIK